MKEGEEEHYGERLAASYVNSILPISLSWCHNFKMLTTKLPWIILSQCFPDRKVVESLQKYSF